MSTKKQRNLTDVSVAEFYHDFDQWLRRFSHMNLARWKIIQQTIISIIVAYLALEAGADPTVALGVIAVTNGIQFSDLIAVWNNPQNPESQDSDPDSETEQKTER